VRFVELGCRNLGLQPVFVEQSRLPRAFSIWSALAVNICQLISNANSFAARCCRPAKSEKRHTAAELELLQMLQILQRHISVEPSAHAGANLKIQARSQLAAAAFPLDFEQHHTVAGSLEPPGQLNRAQRQALALPGTPSQMTRFFELVWHAHLLR
jgi:hypothetical protein